MLINLVLETINLTYKNLVIESESKEYAACSFEIDDKKIKYRLAKITPKKVGAFVTFWKRLSLGSPIVPYDFTDDFDILMVGIQSGERAGLFIFPREVLLQKK